MYSVISFFGKECSQICVARTGPYIFITGGLSKYFWNVVFSCNTLLLKQTGNTFLTSLFSHFFIILVKSFFKGFLTLFIFFHIISEVTVGTDEFLNKNLIFNRKFIDLFFIFFKGLFFFFNVGFILFKLFLFLAYYIHFFL